MTWIVRPLAALACLVAVALPAIGQSATAAAGGAAPAAPMFLAADVHASPKRLHADLQGGVVHGDRYYIRAATMVDLISLNYQVDPSSIFGGPAWLAFDRFDIVAKVPPSTSEEDVRPMVRALLADRFKLAATVGTRPLPAFALSAGKMPRLKPAASPDSAGGCDFQPPPKDATPATSMGVRFTCHNETMKDFAEFLHDVASPYLTRPVVDQTGLKGGWDFDIVWSYQIPKEADGVTIFAAVDKQLGLRLEQKTAALPVVVVASVNETPSANVADIDTILPPAPVAEFDVAVIRPANPDEKHFNINVDASGRVTIEHASLLTLIYQSYDIGPNRIMNQPKWLNTDFWDIVGKAANHATAGPAMPGAGPVLDEDEVKEMIRSLLADRFKFVAHMDTSTQTTQIYALVAANPKMKKADPANHPSCEEGPAPDGKDPRLDNPLLNRLMYCQNMTMAELATRLKNIAGGYVPDPVIDATGLEGAYDFTLSFTKKADLGKTLPAPQKSDSADASEPSEPGLVGLSVFDALQRQLGLKLEKRETNQVAVPVLDIDHVEEQPTEN